ncbi:MAG: helix-turn-helix domain-containing protein [Clostridia bacterium]|nr:helix-turn-helix domain-containing protein [Clostridia bacterium]
MNLTAIGAYIALMRRERGLTQRELAARLGVSCQAVSKWENGENLPDAGILLPLADALHTTADALLSAGMHRPRQPIDMGQLQSGAASLEAARLAFGADSPIGAAIADALKALGITNRETLLAEAILHQLQEGASISNAALEAAITDESLRQRIRKCRHDCALFADKQQHYDHFRPSWPKAVVDFIHETVGEGAVIADIGSGTGKLATLLAPFARVHAVEPSFPMRRVLAARTTDFPSVSIHAATAENTRLPDHSVNAITVAEAYHWFDSPETRADFRRILRPGGRVFLLWNHFRRNPYDEEMQAIQQGHRTFPRPPQRTRAQRADDLFGPGGWQKFAFDNTMHQTFEQFYGGMCSASFAPEDGTVAGKAHRAAVRVLFDKHAQNGRIVTHVETVCYAGQIR